MIIFVDSLHFAAEQTGQDAFVPLVCRLQRIRKEKNRNRSSSINRTKGI
jgi:hypothetical protein